MSGPCYNYGARFTNWIEQIHVMLFILMVINLLVPLLVELFKGWSSCFSELCSQKRHRTWQVLNAKYLQANSLKCSTVGLDRNSSGRMWPVSALMFPHLHFQERWRALVLCLVSFCPACVQVIIHAMSLGKMFKKKQTKPEECTNGFKKMINTYWKNLKELQNKKILYSADVYVYIDILWYFDIYYIL